MAEIVVDTFDEVYVGAKKALEDVGYSRWTINKYSLVWRNYHIFKATFMIDKVSIDMFLEKRYGIDGKNVNLRKYQRDARCAMKYLLEYVQTGEIRGYNNPWVAKIPWPANFEKEAESFIKLLKDNDYCTVTIENYARTLKRLTIFLSEQGIKQFSEMTPESISPFITSIATYHGASVMVLMSELRRILRYMYLNEYTEKDLSLFIPKSNVLLSREHLPTTWVKEDVEKILACIDVASPTGKRDYAMILLVAKTGLRVSDIIHLNFDNIKWEKNCIELTQYKTKNVLSLPLFEDVGNAIIDYIQNGRPTIESKTIFVRHQAPYMPFSPKNHLYGTFNRYLSQADIVVTPEKSHGMHTLRHTLATDLVKQEVPLPIISKILGHTNTNTTANYLRLDVEQLRYCTLQEGVSYAAQTR